MCDDVSMNNFFCHCMVRNSRNRCMNSMKVWAADNKANCDINVLVFEGESGFTTHLRGGYQVIILAETVIVLSVCIIDLMKIVPKHSPFTTFVDSYTFEAWGARSRMPMLLCDLDLSEIACTPAIGSWTLTTRGTIFK